MKVLAIDTAANLCATCVFDADSDRVLASRSLDIGKGHVEELMPLISEVLGESDCRYGDIGRLAVTIGPGSFTGVRVGVAAARGFALALKIPVVGVTTLAAIAAETRATLGKRPVMVALDARRDQFYTAIFDASGNEIESPSVTTIESAARLAEKYNPVLAGNAASTIANAADGMFETGQFAATASIATIARCGTDITPDGTAPKPVYLRAPDAKPQTGFAVERVAG